MDAAMASLEVKANEAKADSKVKSDELIADLKKRRDEFQPTLKTQAEAGTQLAALARRAEAAALLGSGGTHGKRCTRFA